MTTTMDRETIYEAYEDVRNDQTSTNWALFTFDENKLVVNSTGQEFEELKATLAEDTRAFAFLRVYTGDELSRRTKFVLITFIGEGVPPLKKAGMSTAKATVKTVIKTFAKEFLFNEVSEITEEHILEQVQKAGGANYGTGQ